MNHQEPRQNHLAPQKASPGGPRRLPTARSQWQAPSNPTLSWLARSALGLLAIKSIARSPQTIIRRPPKTSSDAPKNIENITWRPSTTPHGTMPMTGAFQSHSFLACPISFETPVSSPEKRLQELGMSVWNVGVSEGRCKATWKREFKLPWREAGPPNHHEDKVDSDQ